MEEVQRKRKKKSQRPNCSSGLPFPPGSPLPEVVDELPTELIELPITTPCGPRVKSAYIFIWYVCVVVTVLRPNRRVFLLQTFFYSINDTEHWSRTPLTTRDRELVSVL